MTNATVQRQRVLRAPTLSVVSSVLATAVVLLAPFTWSYVASVGGLLIRAVDLMILISVLVMAVRVRQAKLPLLVPACLLGLICLSLLRSVVISDVSAMISAMKISYYLVGALVLATAFRDMLVTRGNRAILFAIFLSSPILIFFLINLGSIFLDVLQSRSVLNLSQAIFRGWNELFSNNLFGVSESLEVSGVEFRNSAGVAFLVAGIFFYLWDGMINRVFMIVLMVIAALMFSRSVWLIQLLLIALLVIRLDGLRRSVLLLVILCCMIAISLAPTLYEALAGRINSNFGRSEMLSIALDAFGTGALFGRAEGAEIILANGEYKSVHNVALAFALKTGILGFLLSITIAFSFLWTAATHFVLLFSTRDEDHKMTIAVILLSVILFVRPMISASHDIYFSIGEWCALAILMAMQARMRDRRRTNISSNLTD